MTLIIDANVLKGYFDETVIGIDHTLTDSAKDIFDAPKHDIYIDDGDQIKHEWSNVVDPEWLDVWLATQLRDQKILIIAPCTKLDFANELKALGFPHSRDIWYIKTAAGCQTAKISTPTILSEDIDFYDPTKKNQATGAARIRLMKKKSSPVRKLLNRRASVEVMCVSEYLT